MQSLEENRFRLRAAIGAKFPRSEGGFLRSSLFAGGLVLAISAFNSPLSADVASDLASGISVQEAILNAINEGKDLVAIQAEFALNGWDVEFVEALALVETEEGETLAEAALLDIAAVQETLLGVSFSSETMIIGGIRCGFVGAGSNIMRCEAPQEEFERAGVRRNLQTAQALQNARMQQSNPSSAGGQTLIAGTSTGEVVPEAIGAPAAATAAVAETPVVLSAPEVASAPEVVAITPDVVTAAPVANDQAALGLQAGLGVQTNLNIPVQTQATQGTAQVAPTLAGETSQWSYRLWDQNRASGSNALAANDDSSVNSVAVITDGNVEQAVEIVDAGGTTSTCPDGSRGFGDCGIPSPN